MRRSVMPLVAALLSAIVAGCGSSSTPEVASSGLSTELSYFPAQSALVATIATDPHGAAVQNVNALLGAVPLAKLGITALESSLASRGLNYQSGIEPLFGNPIVVGALNPSSPGTSFLAAWTTRSAAKLAVLVKGLRGVTAGGTLDGATLYRVGSMTVALDGPTAVVGSSAAEVGAALGRHAHGGGMSPTEFLTGTADLPRDAFVRVFGNDTGVLAGARTVPWVGAIRKYEASLSASTTGLSVQFRIDTTGGSLTSTQLPIAPGAGPPELAGTLPIAVGVRDPAQTIAFINAIERALDPAAATPGLAHDLNALAALLTGELTVESDAHTTMTRAGVSDRALAARQLARLPGASRQPGGFFALKAGRGTSVDLGLVGQKLVAGVATPAQLRAFAAAPATPAPNGQGSLALRISVLELVRLALPSLSRQLGADQLGLAQAFLSSLGDVTGSASAAPAAVTGELGLSLK